MPETPKSSKRFADPARKLERLLLSQGFCRGQWDAQLKLMNVEDKKTFAECVDDDGLVSRGSREKFEAWRHAHIHKVREAAAKEPAKETGKHASE
jgi:hypothetical protein